MAAKKKTKDVMGGIDMDNRAAILAMFAGKRVRHDQLKLGVYVEFRNDLFYYGGGHLRRDTVDPLALGCFTKSWRWVVYPDPPTKLDI